MIRSRVVGRRRTPALAAAVCAVLASCAPAEDVETLFADLNHPDFETRLEAGEQLTLILREGRFKAFLRGLESENLLVRANSIVYLGQMPQPSARQALRGLLDVDRRMMLPYNPIGMKPSREMSDSRILVATMISRTGGDPEAIDVLLDAADTDHDAETVVGTCLAIGALGDRKGVPFLDAATNHDDDEVVRAAVEALGHLRSPEALAALGRRVGHPAFRVRIDIVSSLGMWEYEEFGDLMRTIGANDPAPEIRVAAIQRLANAKRPALVPYLIERMKDGNPRVRSVALQSLERITGAAPGPGVESWKSWWEANEASLPASR